MKRSIFVFSVFIITALLLYPEATVSFSTGSPGGKTGSPLDNTDCTSCHGVISTSSALTSINSNIPSSGYVPGNTYTITATINPTSIVSGFEITSEENLTNTKTGTFFITNSTTTQLTNNGSAVTHTAGGNALNAWSFDWQAPSTGTGDITFYGAFIEAGYPFGQNFDDYFSSTTLIISEFIAPALTYVPDDNFEAYLEANGMGNGIANDDSVLTANINNVTTLLVNNQGIADLTGVEDFISLAILNCRFNQLTNLNISNNTLLTYLKCDDNQLTNLDISNNTNITQLQCDNNQLTNLDVSQNIALERLYCNNNQLTSLDVSNNTALTYLACYSNQLTSLDVNGAAALTDIFAEGNYLTSLDVSQNTALDTLYCDENQLTSLDVSQNTALILLSVSGNLLTSLDVRNGNNINFNAFYSTNNSNLYCIDVDNPSWSTANWPSIDTQHYFSNNCSAMNFDCTDSLQVTDVIIDNSNLTMNIAIYNGYNYFLNYPYVAFTIDANGDTIQAGNMNLFGAVNLDTTWYNYSINSVINPSYPLTMYFVYSDGSLVTDTCILTYNLTPTAIINTNISINKKLISIFDVLGRESKVDRNEPRFYIYNDGTVEKRIVVE